MQPHKPSAPSAPPGRFILISMAGAALAIGATAWLAQQAGVALLMAPFGASCVLAFGLPDSPLAQPRSIVGGHFLSTLVGFAALAAWGPTWWSAALSVALALGVMLWTRTVHAPAGANPLVVLATAPSISFLVTPVLAGSLIIVACAWVVNNARARRSYPRYWW